MALPPPSNLDSDIGGFIDLRRKKERADIEAAIRTALGHDPPLAIVLDEEQEHIIPAGRKVTEEVAVDVLEGKRNPDRNGPKKSKPCISVSDSHGYPTYDADGNITGRTPRNCTKIRYYVAAKDKG